MIASRSNILDERNQQLPGRYSFSGMIQNIDILDYIQFLMISGIRTILELRLRQGPTSRLFIDDGRILHAESGELDGEEAFYRCLQADGGIFIHVPWSEPGTRTIEASWEFLLLQAARKRDERLSGAAHEVSIPAPIAEERVDSHLTRLPRL
jgi:hypothetical protein